MTEPKVKRFDFDSLLNGEVRMAELHDGEYVRYDDMLVALEALEKIANADYRGNRSHESGIAFKALERIGKGVGK